MATFVVTHAINNQRMQNSAAMHTNHSICCASTAAVSCTHSLNQVTGGQSPKEENSQCNWPHISSVQNEVSQLSTVAVQ